MFTVNIEHVSLCDINPDGSMSHALQSSATMIVTYVNIGNISQIL